MVMIGLDDSAIAGRRESSLESRVQEAVKSVADLTFTRDPAALRNVYLTATSTNKNPKNLSFGMLVECDFWILRYCGIRIKFLN
jgi:hypothetical protein